MRYTEIMLQSEDIMWFGVDKHGHIFECTSGGIGNVPKFVCCSKENNETLNDYFLAVLDRSINAILITNTPTNPLNEDCLLLSQKGIYCFDVDIEQSTNPYYYLSAS